MQDIIVSLIFLSGINTGNVKQETQNIKTLDAEIKELISLLLPP